MVEAKFLELKKFFADPTVGQNDEMASLASDTVQVLAQIYATHGRIDQMPQKYQDWLNSSVGKPTSLKEAVGLILLNEAATRRFDHKFMGQIHPQGNIVGIMGSFIGAYLNTNSVVREVSPAENIMECQVLDWLADMVNYDRKTYSGNIVTGGTTANLAAMWVAREKILSRLRRQGIRTQGKNLYVIGTEMAHYSIAKSCDILGLKFIETPTEGFKTDPERVEDAIVQIQKAHGQIASIIGLAGETETGMIDNLEALAQIAQRYNVSLHVDGAYGGAYVLSAAKPLFKGIELADSITIDPHKMLFTPYPSGVILFKDKVDHALIDKIMREKARYLLPDEFRRQMGDQDQDRNFGQSRVEGSMGTGGTIATWATIKLFGKDGVAELLNHTIDLTCHAYEAVNNSEFLHPLHIPETNTLLIGINIGNVSHSVHNSIVQTVRERVETRTGYYISANGEIDNGFDALRFVAMHPYTTKEDIDKLILALEQEIKTLVSYDNIKL